MQRNNRTIELYRIRRLILSLEDISTIIKYYVPRILQNQQYDISFYLRNPDDTKDIILYDPSQLLHFIRKSNNFVYCKLKICAETIKNKFTINFDDKYNFVEIVGYNNFSKNDLNNMLHFLNHRDIFSTLKEYVILKLMPISIIGLILMIPFINIFSRNSQFVSKLLMMVIILLSIIYSYSYFQIPKFRYIRNRLNSRKEDT